VLFQLKFLVFAFALTSILPQGCSKPADQSSAAKLMVQNNQTQETLVGARVSQGDTFKGFDVYVDGGSLKNHFVASGWMGDYGDIKMDEKSTKRPRSGATCIKTIYTGRGMQGARWAGVYWQNPPNNWGTRPGGYDLRGAKKLTFWARGEIGGEKIQEFKMGGLTGEYADSDIASTGLVTLTTEWQQFTIDLQGKDLSYISGGFCWATNVDANPAGCTFYLDDVRYE